MVNQKSALGMEGNLAAAIGYPIGIIALILVFIEKDNKFVRFHAIQSLLWGLFLSVAATILLVLFLVFWIFSGVLAYSTQIAALGWIGLIATLLSGLGFLVIALGGLLGTIMAVIKAYGNQAFKLPIVGKLAAKWSGI